MTRTQRGDRPTVRSDGEAYQAPHVFNVIIRISHLLFIVL